MRVNFRITANVNLRLLFSTDLLRDYENNPPNPQQANIDAFLDAVTQEGGPVAAAFNYLDSTQPQRSMPNYVVG